MDEIDYTDILNYLRELVRKVHLSDLDDVASMESRTLASPKQRLEVYLYMIINMLKERSGSQAINIYDRLRRSIEVEDNSDFQGVVVQLSGSEREIYGMDRYSIDEMDDYASVIRELQKILDEIKMEPEPPTNDFNQGPSL